MSRETPRRVRVAVNAAAFLFALAASASAYSATIIEGGTYVGVGGSAGGGPLGTGIAGNPDFFGAFIPRASPNGTPGGAGGQGPSGPNGGAAASGYLILGNSQLVINGGSFIGGSGGVGGRGGAGGFSGWGEFVTNPPAPGLARGGDGGRGGNGGQGGAGGLGGFGLFAVGQNIQVEITGGSFDGGVGGTGGTAGSGATGGKGGPGVNLAYNNQHSIFVPPTGLVPNPDFNPAPIDAVQAGGNGGHGGVGGAGGAGGNGGSGLVASGANVRIDIYGGQFGGARGGQGGGGGQGGAGDTAGSDFQVSVGESISSMYYFPADYVSGNPGRGGAGGAGGEGGLASFGSAGQAGKLGTFGTKGNYGGGLGGNGALGGMGGLGGFGGFGLFADDTAEIVIHASEFSFDTLTGRLFATYFDGSVLDTTAFEFRGGDIVWSQEPLIPSVPEPSTYAMLLGGLLLLGYRARRRNERDTGSAAPSRWNTNRHCFGR